MDGAGDGAEVGAGTGEADGAGVDRVDGGGVGTGVGDEVGDGVGGTPHAATTPVTPKRCEPDGMMSHHMLRGRPAAICWAMAIVMFSMG